MLMFMASNKRIMGKFRIGSGLKIMGWLTTLVMAGVALTMFATWNNP